MKGPHVENTASPFQKWSPKLYRRNAGFVSDFGQSVVTLLAPKYGEHILDLGCGDGLLTELIAGAGANVVGIDKSPDQITACNARGLNAFVCDGHSLPFNSKFDAVFSNAALHWMKDADSVLGGVRHSLKKGGRFVAEFGGEGNIATLLDTFYKLLKRHGIETSAMANWYFPDPDSYHKKLKDHGFTVNHMELFSRPTKLPFGIEGWMDTFGGPFLDAFPPEKRHLARTQAIDNIELRVRDSEGYCWADYVRLRFAAHLTE